MPDSSSTSLVQKIDDFWYNNALAQFKDFVTIPCVSPSYDPDWQQNGYLAQARQLAENWIGNLTALNAKIYTGPEKTVGGDELPPVLLVQIPAFPAGTPGNVLTYGHFD